MFQLVTKGVCISSVLLDSLLQNAALIPCLFMLRHGWLIFCFARKKRVVDSGSFRKGEKKGNSEESKKYLH